VIKKILNHKIICEDYEQKFQSNLHLWVVSKNCQEMTYG